MVWRVMKTGSGVFAVRFEDVESEASTIQEFVEEGYVIVIGEDLNDIAEAMEVHIDEILIASDE